MNQRISKNKNCQAYHVHMKGRVQGVGFRPFVFNLAKSLHLAGYVFNRPDGVIAHIEGNAKDCDAFLHLIRIKAPPAANIKDIIYHSIGTKSFRDFKIIPSRQSDRIITEISPDIAVCNDCLKEMYSENRRNHYPFINCTNCGPRFTIVDDFPYDRVNSTMNEFTMCRNCMPEFDDPLDRRFHAQPISCPDCGPVYEYFMKGKRYNNFENLIKTIGGNINKGKVVAMKGLGGYNLSCDATNEKAVEELRKFKIREKKPFAVMFRSLETVKEICNISVAEEEILISWRRPIVVIDQMMENILAPNITSGLHSIGVFLPYLPLHYLLFDQLQSNAIVLTSGNESDIPILCNEEKALETFKKISGGILINNRKIARRADDSVVKVISEHPRILRRARGYTPEPVDLGFDASGILATGAELSNCFCIGKEQQAILSQHIGDLKNMETYDFFCENIAEFSRLYRFKPHQIACDLHPDYLSTQYAQETNLPLIRVQHHHAHTTAVMAEYKIKEPVIGISYDGVGYGTDGNIWGSEALIADYNEFNRISHFEYVPLPGGDLATKQPWRSGLSYLYHTFGINCKNLDIPFLTTIGIKKTNQLIEAIDHSVNSPLCCSAGRLFDAIAAILGICHKSNYHAEAPLRLENHLTNHTNESYTFSGDRIISCKGMIQEIVKDIQKCKPLELIVTKFHNTVASIAMYQVHLARKESNINKVVLSGGTFQNKYVTEKIVPLLRKNQYDVYYPQVVPCNDGGIALGQLAVAANKRK